MQQIYASLHYVFRLLTRQGAGVTPLRIGGIKKWYGINGIIYNINNI